MIMKFSKKLIAKWFLILLLIIFVMKFPAVTLSQVPDTNANWYFGLYEPDVNFYHVRQKGWDYFNSHSELDTLKGTGFKDLIRWEQFWQDRVYNYGNQDGGSYDIAFDAMNNFVEHRGDYFQNAYKENLSWHFFGPDNLSTQTMGFVSCIDVDQSSSSFDIIYAGTNASGLFKTTDGGKHWICVTDTIGLPGLGVQDVGLDPNNSSVLYICTGTTTYGRGYGNGIYKSCDAGLSWQNIFNIANPEQKVVNKVLIDPENPSRLFALINDEVYRTNDGGQNWIKIFNSLVQPPNNHGRKNLQDIEFNPGSTETLYISSNGMFYDDENGIRHKYTAEIWRCSNAKDEDNIAWTRIDDDSWPYNERIELAVTNAAPDIVYASFSFKLNGPNQSDTFALYKTHDRGDHWKIHTKSETNHGNYSAHHFGGVNTHRSELVVSPNDTDVIYVGGYYIDKITNNGQIIESNNCGHFICNNFHVDVRELIIASGSDPGTGGNYDILFAGNDGGISKTIDGAKNWESINGSGLTITQFYGLDIATNIPEFVSAGCQDNGWYLSQPLSGTWTNYVKGDNYQCLTDYFSPNISYSTAFGGTTPKVVYTLDGGSGIMNGEFNLPDEPAQPDWPFVIDPVNSSILYTGLREVYKITKGVPYYQIDRISHLVESPYLVDSGASFSALAVWGRDPNVIYAVYGSPTWKFNSNPEKKIFKTIDGGYSWVDLSASLTFLQYLGITDILIDPEDHNKVWITLGGFCDPPGTKRVIYSEDSFLTFSDISNGLPNLPVNRIKMATPDVHQLFVANDAGVFYKNDTMERWMNYVNGTPVAIFSDIEINRKYNLIYVSTFGRGIWYTEGTFPCPDVSYHDTITVNHDTNWTSDMRLHHNLKIANGAQLTIKGNVYIGEANKIMIDRGGKLILDGCLLTNSCNGDYWQGIEVWGNVNKSQLQNNYQGTIELRNGATIENALIAIATIKTDSIFHGTEGAGGIIKANDSHFRNNRVHIQFYRYTNFYPWDSIHRTEIPNLSYFSNCDFTTGHPENNIQLYGLRIDGVNGIPFNLCKFKFVKEIDTMLADYNKSLVYLLNATDIKFLGCEFNNESYYYMHYLAVPKRGIGIYSYNSSFEVQPCIGINGPICSSFNKLTYGIKALSLNSIRQFTIDNCRFNLTFRGIYNSGTRYQTITSNTFNLPSQAASTSEFPSYGIYLDNCSQYHVENNYITAGVYSTLPIGIIVNNSGGELNMIYRNRFEDLGYGIIAQNDNRGDDGIVQSGLKIKCNEFDLVLNNIYVGPEDAYTRQGISKYQGFTGSPSAPAGNQFSHLFLKDKYTDYHNLQRNIIYFHHDTTQSPPELNLVPWYYTNWSITRQTTQYAYTAESCPPTLENDLRDNLRNSIVLEDAEIDTSSSVLEAWIDGGNTEQLQEDIDYSTPPDGYDLRNDLLSESPYLSDIVMINAIEQENVLTDALIRDILVANPQAAKSSEIMTELDQRTINLPEYMIAEIEQGLYSVSQKESLEAELSYHYQERTLARNALISSFINDTTISSLDSLINVYDYENDKMLKYDLAFQYLANKDSVNTMNTLTSIPFNYSLTSSEQALHQKYLDYFEIWQDLMSEGKTEFELDSIQILNLYSLENGGYIPVSAFARNILQVIDTLIYHEPILLPITSEKSVNAPTDRARKQIEKDSYLAVYPNPARNFFIVDYIIPTPGDLAVLRLIDARGILVKEIPLTSSQNKFTIGTGNLQSGIYFCNLVENNRVKESAKIIVKH
jgi:hypothetical protein